MDGLTIGERLDDLRCEKGKTLQEISDEIKEKYGVTISKGTLSKTINNKSIPQGETIIYLSKYFNVSADYLLGLSEPFTTDNKLKFVCEYTGLNEKAVSFLNSHKRDKEIIEHLLNMQESSYFLILISELEMDYKEIIYLLQLINADYIEDSENTDILKKIFNKYFELSKELEFKEYELQKSHNKIIDDYFSSAKDKFRCLHKEKSDCIEMLFNKFTAYKEDNENDE